MLPGIRFGVYFKEGKKKKKAKLALITVVVNFLKVFILLKLMALQILRD